MPNLYGSIGDFFNDKARQYTDAAKQVSALGHAAEAHSLREKAAHCCELFAAYISTENARKASQPK